MPWSPTHILTHAVAHCPSLVIVKVDVSLPMGSGKKGVGEDSSRPIKWQAVPVPVPVNPTQQLRKQQYRVQLH